MKIRAVGIYGYIITTSLNITAPPTNTKALCGFRYLHYFIWYYSLLWSVPPKVLYVAFQCGSVE